MDPPDTDAVAFAVAHHAATATLDVTDDLVPEDDRQSCGDDSPFDLVKLSVADAASGYPQEHLVRAGHRHWQIRKPQRGARRLDGPHGGEQHRTHAH
jgi:hypothetical protein